MELRSWIIAAAAAGSVLANTALTVAAAEKFRHLTGAQIRDHFVGMELGDDVHWQDTFRRDGTLLSLSMGKERSGKWRVENNQLCIDLGKDSGGCYDVWLAGSNVEYRRNGLDGSIMEGRLRKASTANQTAKGKHK
jgi:hypothetical protein